MRQRLETVRQLREITGWGWVRTAAFVYAYGPEMAKVSVSALEGVKRRNVT